MTLFIIASFGYWAGYWNFLRRSNLKWKRTIKHWRKNAALTDIYVLWSWPELMKVPRIFFRLVSSLDHRRASLDTQDSLLEPRKPHHHQHWIPLMTPIVKTSSLGLNKSRRNLSTANYVWFILFFSLIICTLCQSTIKCASLDLLLLV